MFFMLELLNQHVLASKLNFESFVEPKKPTKILIEYLKFKQHKIISTIIT